MSDASKGGQNASEAVASKAALPKEGNPAFRMLGLPRIRARLPSRNWTIFLTVVGSFSGAVIYDRYQRRKAQQHWCNAVSHLSREPLGPDKLPRKLTVYLAAPPGDGLRPSREFFVEYVKPVLVAAAVDWEVVEGRNEGDVRAKLAKRIRKSRIDSGEKPTGPVEEHEDDLVGELRREKDVQATDKRRGELILGRHTWKEYVRGLHEGWLGPLEIPQSLQDDKEETAVDPSSTTPLLEQSAEPSSAPTDSLLTDQESNSQQSPASSTTDALDEAKPIATDGGSPTATEVSKQEDAETKNETKPKPKPAHLPPFITPTDYSTANVASSTPPSFDVSAPIGQQHLLGFLNTPVRIYRFLNRRRVADSTGRHVATLLLAEYTRPYHSPLVEPVNSGFNSGSDLSNEERSESAESMWESQSALLAEEHDWHKSARQPSKEGEEDKERPWKEPLVVDLRIAERMCTPDSDTVSLPSIDVTAEEREEGQGATAGRPIGNYREWRGGADPILRKLSWSQWFLEATGFDDRKEPRGLGAKDGLVDDGA